jgi:hypothetical protein
MIFATISKVAQKILLGKVIFTADTKYTETTNIYA